MFLALANLLLMEAAVGQSIDYPLSPDIVLAPAARDQYGPRVASGPGMSFIAWVDSRAGYHTNIFGTRVDAEGRVLDPLGIVVSRGQNGSIEAAIWNGSEFAIFIAEYGNHYLVRISIDGTVSASKLLAPTWRYRLLAATSVGDGRALFMDVPSPNPAVLLLDGRGDVVAPAFLLPSLGADDGNFSFAGSGPDGFLILRSLTASSSAHRVSLDGRLLSSVSSRLKINPNGSSYAVAGSRNGWALVRTSYNSVVHVLRLDGTGGYSGTADETLLSGVAQSRGVYQNPSLTIAGDRCLAAWPIALSNGHSLTYLARIPLTGFGSEVRQAVGWAGATAAVALDAAFGRATLATTVSRLGATSGTDIFHQTVTDGLDVSAAIPTTFSGAVESRPAIALHAGGAIVHWLRSGPDEFSRLLVRRVGNDGAFIDQEPKEVTRFPISPSDEIYVSPKVASNGEVDLVSYQIGGVVQGRRLNARSGEWIDPQPFEIGKGYETVSASNGRDALVSWTGSCAVAGGNGCLFTRRIALTGDPLPGITSPVTTKGAAHEPALGSNGIDYLLTWSDGFRCGDGGVIILCGPESTQIRAARIRPDGTRIDPATLAIDNGKNYATLPSVVWTGDRYTLVWSAGAPLRAARVTAQGDVLETGADKSGTLVQQGQRESIEPFLAVRGDELFLFTKKVLASAVRFELTSQRSDQKLEDLLSARRFPLFTSAVGSSTMPFAAGPEELMIVYERISAEAGNVPRAFLRRLGDPRRRSAVH